jgi:hypothetical protein
MDEFQKSMIDSSISYRTIDAPLMSRNENPSLMDENLLSY